MKEKIEEIINFGLLARKPVSWMSDQILALMPESTEGISDAHICHDGKLCETYASGLCSRELTSKSFSFYTTQEELEKLKVLFDITPKGNGA